MPSSTALPSPCHALVYPPTPSTTPLSSTLTKTQAQSFLIEEIVSLILISWLIWCTGELSVDNQTLLLLTVLQPVSLHCHCVSLSTNNRLNLILLYSPHTNIFYHLIINISHYQIQVINGDTLSWKFTPSSCDFAKQISQINRRWNKTTAIEESVILTSRNE